MQIADVIRWSAFWLGVPSGDSFTGEVVVVRSTKEIGILAPSIDLRILFPVEIRSGDATIRTVAGFSPVKEVEVADYELSLRN